jgi:hypothetical protein
MTGPLKTIAARAAGLQALRGGPAARRRARLAGSTVSPVPVSKLDDAPDWLGAVADRHARQDLELRAALLSIGPALGRSIDGAWLQAIAEAAGADRLDWACVAAGGIDVGLGPCEAGELPERGRALLLAALPDDLAIAIGAAAATPIAAVAREVLPIARGLP